MLVIGLTGNIAAGKSTVAAQLAALGATVIDSDLLARDAVTPGSEALDRIRERWGGSLVRTDGTLDRAALRRIVFADETERSALNAIVHPEVERLRQSALDAARASGAKLVVCDVPLLFEVGLESRFDRILLVDAPEETRRDRLVRDRGLSAAEANSMIASQMPATLKRRGADYVLDNVGTAAELSSKVELLFAELERHARSSA